MPSRYRVTGVDGRTGREAEMLFEASSLSEAERLAARQGVTPRKIERVEEEGGEAPVAGASRADGGAPGGEREVWHGGASQWANFPLFLLCVLVIPIPYVLWRALATRLERYTLTTERLLRQRGVFSRTVDELELYRVRDVTATQTFWQRLVGIGDIVLATSDRSDPSEVIRGVTNHRGVMDLIREHTENMRRVKRVRELDVE